MNAIILDEPELEFGGGRRHVDVRFGLGHFGPVDAESRPEGDLEVAAIGTSETIEAFATWMAAIDRGVDAKESSHPNFFPAFPGYSGAGAFRRALTLPSRMQRTLPPRELRSLLTNVTDPPKAIRELVDLVTAELRYLGERGAGPAVTVILLPVEASVLQGYALPAPAEEGASRRGGRKRTMPIELHDLLKARAMQEKRIVQVVWPHTYDASKARAMARDATVKRRLQDEATRAWNLCTALYYKAGGTPWRLVRRRQDLTSLHVGVRFYRTLDGEHLHTSLAQVFDERGDGTIIRGGAPKYDKEDRQPHLDQETAARLLRDALTSYRREHSNFPARVVVHKSSSYNVAEADGFRDVAQELSISSLDLVSIGEPEARLFRDGTYPPLRGTMLSLGSRSHVLYTRGSVPFFQMYPGMYVPRPLGIRCEDVEGSPREIAAEILALTKMNWNNTQFDGRLPITLRAAAQVSDVLRYVEEGQSIESQYRYYM